jgi:DNA-binding LacI/PurR family transcriptional regulator
MGMNIDLPTKPSEILTPSKTREPGSKDRVLQFLKTWFKENSCEQGARLPSIRDIAHHTRASASTVYAVFRQLARNGNIRTELGSGSYLISPPGQRQTLRIALNIPAEKSVRGDEYWKNSITAGILAGAAAQHPRMMILPCATNSYDPGLVSREILAEMDEVNGLILFPDAVGDVLRSTYEKAGKFVVDVNPPDDNATANFVSPDYLTESRRIGTAWLKTGRKRVAFISHSPLETSVSARLRLCGLFGSFGEALGKSIFCQIIVADGARQADGAKVMRTILNSNQPLPDAIYCVADLQAIGMLDVLREVSVCVPETISVISGTGITFNDAYHNSLTRTRQPLEEMGKALVTMIADRCKFQGSVPAIYLPMEIVGGGTTTAEENRLLGLVSAPHQPDDAGPTP